MIEPWLGGIILITVFLVVLALYMVSRPTLPSREETERSEILEILRRIEAALNRESCDSAALPEAAAKAAPDAPITNPKDRHEEND